MNAYYLFDCLARVHLYTDLAMQPRYGKFNYGLQNKKGISILLKERKKEEKKKEEKGVCNANFSNYWFLDFMFVV